MAMKTKKTTLADKISSLITAAPFQFGSDNEDDITSAKVVENFEESDTSENDFRQSKLRKHNVDLLEQVDKRYKGKKVSRKDLNSEEENNSIDNDPDIEQSEKESHVESAESDQDETSNDETESEEDNDRDTSIQKSMSEDDDDDDRDNEEEEEDEDDDEDDDDYDKEYHVDSGNPLRRNREIPDNFKTMSDMNVNAEIEKGNCVRSQLKVWEHLLEMRIQLQKCLITSNQMPQCNVYENFKVEPEFRDKTNDVKNKLINVLDKMLKLQTILFKQYPETKTISSERKNSKTGKRKSEDVEDNSMDEEIPSETDDESMKDSRIEEEGLSENEGKTTETKSPRKKRKLPELEQTLSERHKMYVDYRDSVIQKWNDKTRVITGSINKDVQQTALKQIEFALLDKDKLRKRAQLKRSEYVIIGKPLIQEEDDERRTQEHDPEIYDDDDFYHQLLRDLIEHKCTGVTDPVQLSKQWIQLQNIRSKMKRRIDTRATKGRKVRYNVHNKLVNFMAPITVHDTWTDVAKTELYNSLFGKMKMVEK